MKELEMTITVICDVLGEENNGTTIACMNLIYVPSPIAS